MTTTSADLTAALTPGPPIPMAPDSAETTTEGVVVDEQTFRTALGFGATFTDSSAWLVQHAPLPDVRAELMSRVSSAGGARLSLLRQPMSATDFVLDARGPYFGYFTYDDEPPSGSDPDLAHFSIGHDEPYVLPTRREAPRVNPDILIMLTA